VVGDRVAAVAERRPPFVIGDGVHTVEELVAIENLSSLRGTTMKSPLQNQVGCHSIKGFERSGHWQGPCTFFG